MLKRLALTYSMRDVWPKSVRNLRQALIPDDPRLDDGP